ncbi:NmrA domain-containing protein [Mycena venus]|uniref:NmrA domain-containing protein n=1 Tax=Mycena venus TaxID=2733690 RepID=A0A8H6X5K8_9AGAR|nr:NmrA domain-containing protein [Mycena venus]
MASPRIVSVFGATGLQGGAVVDALLKDGNFVPRAIARDPESETSKKLKARGVEVVKGDSLDKVGLVSALRGSEAVFAVTVPVFFLPDMEGKGELVQGKNIVCLVLDRDGTWPLLKLHSSLPSISKISDGKYKSVVHYEEKEAVREYLKSSGLAHASLLLPAFLENLWTRHILKKTEKGYDLPVPIYKATDLEAFAWISRDVPSASLVLLKNYADPAKQINGKAYPVVNANISYAKLAQMIGNATDVEVTFTGAPPTGMVAMDEMFAAHAEYSGLYTATPVPNPELVALRMKFSTIEEFMETEVKARFGH